MRFGRGGVSEAAGGFDDDLSAVAGPVDLGGHLDAVDLDAFSVDGDFPVGRLHVGVQTPQNGVVLQQVRERFRVGQVVGRHDFDARLGLTERGAQHVAPDPPKAVDRYFNGHAK